MPPELEDKKQALSSKETLAPRRVLVPLVPLEKQIVSQKSFHGLRRFGAPCTSGLTESASGEAKWSGIPEGNQRGDGFAGIQLISVQLFRGPL